MSKNYSDMLTELNAPCKNLSENALFGGHGILKDG